VATFRSEQPNHRRIRDDPKELSVDGKHPVMWQLRRTLFIAILCCVACSRHTFTERDMTGEYHLYINSPYTNPKQPNDRLVLAPGGQYSHRFTSANHEVRQQSGSWSVHGDRVYIWRWADYAGITGLAPRGERVVDLKVIVESRAAGNRNRL